MQLGQFCCSKLVMVAVHRVIPIKGRELNLNNELIYSPNFRSSKITVVYHESDTRTAMGSMFSTKHYSCLGSMFSTLPDLRFARFMIWFHHSLLFPMNRVLWGVYTLIRKSGMKYMDKHQNSHLLYHATSTCTPPSPTLLLLPPCCLFPTVPSTLALHLPSRSHTCYSSRTTPMAIRRW